MKHFLLLLICLLLYLYLPAQGQSALEKIEAAKIALITERLELTPEQAEKFWPIYREYAQKERALRQEFQQLKRSYDPSMATEDDSRKLLEKGRAIKERQLGLERTYTERMQQVVSNRQIMNLRKAEDDFRQMLINRIKDQKMQQERRQNERQRNDQNINKRRMN